MHEHVVAHPGRHRPAAGATAGWCGRPACTTPSGCASPAPSARWPGGPARRGTRADSSRRARQRRRRRAPLRRRVPVAGRPAPPSRPTHSLLLGRAEAGRDQHHDPVAVAVGRHGAAAAGAAPHLDQRGAGLHWSSPPTADTVSAAVRQRPADAARGIHGRTRRCPQRDRVGCPHGYPQVWTFTSGLPCRAPGLRLDRGRTVRATWPRATSTAGRPGGRRAASRRRR